MRAPLAELPLPGRYAVLGGLALGLVGAVVGLVVGLEVHAPTAWAATVEVGLPAAALGALIGLVAGSLRVLVLRRRPAAGPPA